ncbi:MAG: CVNH domain-containing protein [Endozoicomonas sp.]
MKTLILLLLFSTFAAAAPVPGAEDELPFFATPPDVMTPEVRSLPKGSYIRSCSECTLLRGILSCKCQKTENRRKSYWTSQLDMRSCSNPSDIANWSGRLMCMTNNSDQLPQGSYLRSCHECRVDKSDQLSCLCRKRNGNWQTTSLSLELCPADYQPISNCNGELRCSSSC